MNTPPENRIVVNDVDIPFSRLVVIVLKLMLASIPAIILFYIIILGIALGIVAIFGGGAALLHGIMSR